MTTNCVGTGEAVAGIANNDPANPPVRKGKKLVLIAMGRRKSLKEDSDANKFRNGQSREVD